PDPDVSILLVTGKRSDAARVWNSVIARLTGNLYAATAIIVLISVIRARDVPIAQGAPRKRITPMAAAIEEGSRRAIGHTKEHQARTEDVGGKRSVTQPDRGAARVPELFQHSFSSFKVRGGPYTTGNQQSLAWREGAATQRGLRTRIFLSVATTKQRAQA